MNDQKKLTLYQSVRQEILDGDLLLWRPSGLFGRLICAASSSQYSHAGIAGWLAMPSGQKRLFSLETIEGCGGRILPLSELVWKHPGLIDVYQANPGDRWPHFDRHGTVGKFLKNVIGKEYGCWAAFKAAMRKMLVLRMILVPNRDDSHVSGYPPFCSGAVSRWTKEGGGVDPVPHLADDSTWPGHLANSLFYKKHFTGLVP